MSDFPLLASLKKSIKNENHAALITPNGFITYKKFFQLIHERESASPIAMKLRYFNKNEEEFCPLITQFSFWKYWVTKCTVDSRRSEEWRPRHESNV